MDQVHFTAADVDNLQRLIDGEPPDEPVKSDLQMKNPNMFFSQLEILLPSIPSSSHPDPSAEFPDHNKENTYSGLNSPSIASPYTPPTHFPSTSGMKDEPSASHFMKFKDQEGRSVKVFECGICGKEFGHQYTLMRHLPTHTDERKFNCLTCGKAFRQMSTLSQHRAIHSTERPYICEVCCKTFNRVSTLISHRKTHTGVKPHRCHLCNKAFHQKGNLRNHIFTHTNERPYKCDICEKGFNQMSNLMCHKLKAHQQYDVIPKYKCKVCGEDFLKRISLRQHEQFQHGMGEEEQTLVTPPKFDYSNAIIVDPIKTEAMRLALASNKTPFALLRPLSGIPVLVRVLPAGVKQLLVPATAEDLKKHGHISITPKAEPGTNAGEGENKENQAPVKSGSVVQIKVPVVATVIQRPSNGEDKMNMSVVSPGPDDTMSEGTKPGESNYVFTSSLSKPSNSSNVFANSTMNSISNNIDVEKQMIADAEFQFLDENEKIITEQEFTTNFELNNQFDFNLQTANSLNDFTTQLVSNLDPTSENAKRAQYNPIQNFVNTNFTIDFTKMANDLTAYPAANNVYNTAEYATVQCSGAVNKSASQSIAHPLASASTAFDCMNVVEYPDHHRDSAFSFDNKPSIENELLLMDAARIDITTDSTTATSLVGVTNDADGVSASKIVVDIENESMVVEKVEAKSRGPAKDMPLLGDFGLATEI